MIVSLLAFDTMLGGGHIDFSDFKTFPIENFLGLLYVKADTFTDTKQVRELLVQFV